MKKIIVSLAVVSAMGSAVFAANMQTGCGLGSMVIKEADSAILFALQATTNGTSANQTFGITSGTSGCEKTKLVMNDKAEDFVAANMDQLAKEVAMGQGETVDTLAELLGAEDKAAFAAALQENYNSIYTSKNVEMSEVLDNIASVEG